MNLREYFGANWRANVAVFESVFRPLYDKGLLLYHRPILSAIGPRVRVWDQNESRERDMLMFGSNNYLGFANDAEIKGKVIEAVEKFGVGMAGPMILNGTGSLQRELERQLAEFKGKEDAMVLPTGYQANLAWVTALMTDQSVLLYDEASHASLIDAVRMGRKKAFRFSAQDFSTLEDQLKKFRGDDATRDIFVSLQGVYSMSGEALDLKTAAGLCEKYEASLVIDDAHGTGVLGGGRGTAEHFGVSAKVKLAMGTFSKAFAVTGGFLAGDRETINFIRFFARSYFFSAAIPPMTAAAVLAGLDIIRRHPERIAKVRENAERLRKGLDRVGIEYSSTETAVVPVFPPVQNRFREIALDVHRENLFINPIEPPAVPIGSERFRVSVMATHTAADIDEAVAILDRVFKKYRR